MSNSAFKIIIAMRFQGERFHHGSIGEGVASYPGALGGGEKRAWYPLRAHALNYQT